MGAHPSLYVQVTTDTLNIPPASYVQCHTPPLNSQWDYGSAHSHTTQPGRQRWQPCPNGDTIALPATQPRSQYGHNCVCCCCSTGSGTSWYSSGGHIRSQTMYAVFHRSTTCLATASNDQCKQDYTGGVTSSGLIMGTKTSAQNSILQEAREETANANTGISFFVHGHWYMWSLSTTSLFPH